MLVDDKQAREKERIANDLCQWCEGYTVKEIFSEALQEYANFCLRENLIRSVEIAAEKDERIESLSAQVEARTSLCTCEIEEDGGYVVKWCAIHSHVLRRAEAAEAQVAELQRQLSIANGVLIAKESANSSLNKLLDDAIANWKRDEAQVAELKKDAERFQFWLDHCGAQGPFLAMSWPGDHGFGIRYFDKDKFRAAIDAAKESGVSP